MGKDTAELAARLRVKGRMAQEMDNHYVHRMAVERIEAADTITAQAAEIALASECIANLEEMQARDEAAIAAALARVNVLEGIVVRLRPMLVDLARSWEAEARLLEVVDAAMKGETP